MRRRNPTAPFGLRIATGAGELPSNELKRRLGSLRNFSATLRVTAAPPARRSARAATARTSAPSEPNWLADRDGAADARHAVGFRPDQGELIEDVAAHRGTQPSHRGAA